MGALFFAVLRKFRQSKCFLIGLGFIILFGLLLLFRGWGLHALKIKQQEYGERLVQISRNSRNAYHLAKDLNEAEEMAREIEARLLSASRKAYTLRIFYALEKLTQIKIEEPRHIETLLFTLPEKEDEVEEAENAMSAEGEETEGQVTFNKPTYLVMTYGMRLEGSFRQILEFLYRLHIGSYFMRITAIDIRLPEESESAGILQAELTVEILGESERGAA